MNEKVDPAVLRAVCRKSPNLFTEFILDVKQAPLHRRMQSHLTKHPDCYEELPRGHGKTQQISARVAFEIGHDPDLRVKYVQQTDDEAKKTSVEIRDIIDSDDYRMIFPEIQPDRDQWAKESWTVKRKRRQRDPTFEACGVLGRAGGRADILVADDICDLRNAVQQAALREQVKEFWRTNWYPMRDLSRRRKPRVWKFGTCYHVNDITADWRDTHRKDGSLLRVPVMDWRSPWPDVFTVEHLKSIREEIGPMAYARSYELVPVASEMLYFPAEWIDNALYEELPDNVARMGVWIAAIDWAFTEKKLKNDPDFSVCLIGRKSDNGHIFVEDMIHTRTQFPEFRRQMISRCQFYGVQHATAEGNGPQKGLVDLVNEEAPFPIRGADRLIDKVSRAAEKQPFVETGRLHLKARRDETGVLRPIDRLKVLYDELTTFPAAEHDDTVDAALDLMDMATVTIDAGPVERFKSIVTPGGMFGR